jgi:hypothetical protein
MNQPFPSVRSLQKGALQGCIHQSGQYDERAGCFVMVAQPSI